LGLHLNENLKEDINIKGKVNPVTCNEGTEGEQIYI
jgi:hypothetical protein